MNDIFNDNVSLKGNPRFFKARVTSSAFIGGYLEDCVKALKRFNDNHFDLAIVDPPYGNVAVFENCQPLERKNESQKNTLIKTGTKQNLLLNIGTNYLEYLKIKLFGAEIISHHFCLKVEGGFIGIKIMEKIILVTENWLGLHLKKD